MKISDYVLRSAGTAIVSDTMERLTLFELAERIEYFIAVLHSIGIRRGNRVAILAPKCINTLGLVLAIIELEAAYIPLSVNDPLERVRTILSQCKPNVTLLDYGLRGLESQLNSKVVHVSLTRDFGIHVTNAELAIAQEADELETVEGCAAILATSGSTGVPKGVLISNGAIDAFCKWMCHLVGLRANDRVVSISPLHFDLSLFEVFAPLLAGSQLFIAPDGMLSKPYDCAEMLAQRETTVLYTVPSVLTGMLRHETFSSDSLNLRTIMFAGEVFPMTQVLELRSRFPQSRLFNLFGPTETNVCTAYELPDQISPNCLQLPIGSAACGSILSILDEEGSVVGKETIGELFVSGPAVMAGHLIGGRPVPVPRPYGTGDLVFEDSEGVLHFRGRRDTQVKVHGGFRVELLEVEAALCSHPNITEAAILLQDGTLIAIVCPTSDPTPSVLSIKQYLSEKLPAYMIPRQFTFQETLPRLPNGKVDRQALVTKIS